MPLSESLPYGIRDIKVWALTSAGAKSGSAVDFPNARTLSFEEAEDFETLEGDDKTVATLGKGASVNWDLEGGGISLEAVVVINGGTLTVSGTAPAQVKTYKKKVTDARPEFAVEGQAMSESGGDLHCVLHRCKATGNFSGEFGNGAFFLHAASGTALPSKDSAKTDELYQFIQNETAVAIATP